jgi:hypothetical protein
VRLTGYLMSRLVPFVIVSGYQCDSLPADILSAPYVQKPFA